ncbi:hypothetical protein DDE01_26200 [Desulfovibrio desulfuricans]|nr:hypothetical protein DDE01_26200 [Desulfovibrio desulfuricans]
MPCARLPAIRMQTPQGPNPTMRHGHGLTVSGLSGLPGKTRLAPKRTSLASVEARLVSALNRRAAVQGFRCIQ